MRGRAAVLGVVVGLLHVVERGRDVNRAAVLGTGRGTWQAREVRELGERDVDLERCASVVDLAHRRGELGRQCRGIEQLEECYVEIGARRHAPRPELRAVLQCDACDAPAAREDAGDRARDADLRSTLAGRRGERVTDPAHAAPHVTPHAPYAVALAHHVVKQYVRCPRRGGRRHSADDGVRRERDLELLGLEPAIEDRARGTCEDLERRGAVTAQPREAPAELAEAQDVAGSE